MRIGIYARNGFLYIPTKAETESGFYFDVEPIEKVAIADDERIIDVLKRLVERANPRIMTPTTHEYSAPAILRHAQVKSVSQFEKNTQYWVLADDKDSFKLIPFIKGKGPGWIENSDQTQKFPKSFGIVPFLKTVIQQIQQQSKRPGAAEQRQHQRDHK